MDITALPFFKLIRQRLSGEKSVPAILLGIILLATLLRFIALGSLPMSIYWDEAAAGYNAYSILQTGKDEYGTAFPFTFRSFDDAKMPVLIYLTVLPVSVLGLNEFSVRFISALAGVLTVFFTYLLVREAFRSGKGLASIAVPTGLLAAFLLTISPWHLQFSRAGFEGTVALCFITAGVYTFLRALTRPGYFFVAFFLFGMSLITYRSSLIFTPLLATGLLMLFLPQEKRIQKKFPLIMSVGIFFLAWVFLIMMFFGSGDTRFAQVSIFSPNDPQVQKMIAHQGAAGNTPVARLLYNRRVAYATIALRNYFSHFDPRFLVLAGDGNPRHTVTGMGVLYLYELPFLLVGIIWLLKKDKRIAGVILVWLLASPLAASISTPAPHALRSLVMLPVPQMLTATGICALYLLLSKKWRLLYITVAVPVILASFFVFLYRYDLHNGVLASSAWADGYKQVVSEVHSREKAYDTVLISGEYWQPYIYFLFYTQYPPARYQRTGTDAGFGKYRFGGTEWDQRVQRPSLRSIDLAKFAGSGKVLAALSPEEFDTHRNEVMQLSKITNHRGETVFIIAELKQ